MTSLPLYFFSHIESSKLTASHLYAEVFAYQSEQCGGEVHFTVIVHWHIHSDEFLVREAIRAFIAKSQRRVHILQHVVHFRIVDLAGGVRIILGPDPHEFVEMVGTQDRRVPREIIEVVHDDGDKEIQHEKRADEDEGHEVSVGDVGAAIFRLLRSLVGLRIAGTALYAIQHDVRLGLTRSAPEKIAS